jgi:hypothetical protein
MHLSIIAGSGILHARAAGADNILTLDFVPALSCP